MSWDQGIQERETLGPKFVEWADSLAEKRGWADSLQYITWFGSDPNIVYLDYAGSGALRLDLTGTKFTA